MNQQITLQTKYADLPDVLKKELDSIDKFINTQTNRNDVNETDLTELIKETNQAQTNLDSLINLLERDLFQVNELLQAVGNESRNCQALTKADNIKDDFYDKYFNNFISNLESRIVSCRLSIEELDSSIKSLSAPKTPAGLNI